MPSGPRDASLGRRFGDAVWLEGREDRRLEREEMERRLLGPVAGGGKGEKNVADRSDAGVVVSSMTAVPEADELCC